MGEAADRKVSEIAETRRRLEADLRELEERLPAPVRSAKAVLGIVAGSTALSALAVRLLRGRSKKNDRDVKEVVIRVVREDQPAASEPRSVADGSRPRARAGARARTRTTRR
jgi:hypothetical protein